MATMTSSWWRDRGWGKPSRKPLPSERGPLLIADRDLATRRELLADRFGDGAPGPSSARSPTMRRSPTSLAAAGQQFRSLVITAGLSPQMAPGETIFQVNLVGNREGAAGIRAERDARRRRRVLRVDRRAHDDAITAARPRRARPAPRRRSALVRSPSRVSTSVIRASHMCFPSSGSCAWSAGSRPPWGARGGRILSLSPGVIDTSMGQVAVDAHAPARDGDRRMARAPARPARGVRVGRVVPVLRRCVVHDGQRRARRRWFGRLDAGGTLSDGEEDEDMTDFLYTADFMVPDPDAFTEMVVKRLGIVAREDYRQAFADPRLHRPLPAREPVPRRRPDPVRAAAPRRRAEPGRPAVRAVSRQPPRVPGTIPTVEDALVRHRDLRHPRHHRQAPFARSEVPRLTRSTSTSPGNACGRGPARRSRATPRRSTAASASSGTRSNRS